MHVPSPSLVCGGMIDSTRRTWHEHMVETLCTHKGTCLISVRLFAHGRHSSCGVIRCTCLLHAVHTMRVSTLFCTHLSLCGV